MSMKEAFGSISDVLYPEAYMVASGLKRTPFSSGSMGEGN